MTGRALRTLAVVLLLGGLGATADAQRPPRGAAGAASRAPSAGQDTARAPRAEVAPDSVMEVLLRLPGYTAVRFSGDTAVFDAGRQTLRLIGDAEVERDGEKIAGEVVTYYEGRRAVRAEGNPRLSSRDQEDLEGEVMYYDLATHRASVVGGRTRLMDGAAWIVHGNVTAEGRDRFYASHGWFTTCDLEVPHYHFEADQIVMIRGKVLVARPARLYFGGVPVFSLPFIVQSLQEGRRSGILTPRFGIADIVQTSSRQRRQIDNVGVYWAINDYMDARLAGAWQSDRYSSLNGAIDYNFRRQFLNGALSYIHYWRPEGGRELALTTSNVWQPTERTNVSIQGNYASSSTLIRDVSFDPRQATQNLQSNASLSQRFDWGSLMVSANRRQQIADGVVTTGFPNASLSLSPITLFRAAPTNSRWFNNGTYQGSFNLRQSSTRIPLDTTGLPVLDPADSATLVPYFRLRRDFGDGTFGSTHSLTMGNLSIQADGTLARGVLQRHPMFDLLQPAGDPLLPPTGGTTFPPLERMDSLTGRWSTSASYRFGLVGSTSVSPSLRMEQDFRRSRQSGDDLVGAPARMHLGTSLNTDLYGFFPGIASFSAIRHKVSPQMSYSYSPQVRQTPRQDTIFGGFSGRAQNLVSLSLRQTFEGRVRAPRSQADTAAADPAGREAPETARTVTILGLDTRLPSYDFIRAREEGVGWSDAMMSNTITSEYMRGLSLSMMHQLFDPAALRRPLDGHPVEAVRLSPRLSSINAGFSLDQNSPIFRPLAIFRRGGGADAGPDIDPTQAEHDPEGRPSGRPGLPGEGFGAAPGMGEFRPGPWRANLSYSYQRNTYGGVDAPALQNLNGSMQFSMTPNWGVSWNTGYSFTDSQFSDHALSLTRNLHRWQANFSYFFSPNGNSSFGFVVHLMDNRDLKFEHHDRSFGDQGRGVGGPR
jgi:hypothetical protein